MPYQSRCTLETDRLVAIGIHAENENRQSHYAAARPKSKVHIGTNHSNSGNTPFKKVAQFFGIKPTGTNARVQLLFAEVAAR